MGLGRLALSKIKDMAVRVQTSLTAWDAAIAKAVYLGKQKAANTLQGAVLDAILEGLECACPLHPGAYSSQDHKEQCVFGRALRVFLNYEEAVVEELRKLEKRIKL